MLNMLDIIYKKREGVFLSKEEIDFFIKGYTAGEIPDYQASALLMAIFFRGVTKEETFYFTDAMMRSGEILDLSDIPGVKVDKHSTGGVGDKTTLIVGPLCAACGVPVAKMSGRGLGFTGGTIDKLEAVPGFQTSISQQKFRKIVRDVGLSVIGQTADIAAADKKLYALRDATATVENKGMITASIMSKKLAAGSDAIVLDVKCGEGAFMKKREMAEILGWAMVEIGKLAGRKIAAFVTDMSQPLGFAVGNSLEVMEAMDTLKGKGPEDITELAVSLAGYMVYLGEKAESHQEGMEMVRSCLKNGAGLAKLREFLEAQGGDGNVTEHYGLFLKPLYQAEVLAPKELEQSCEASLVTAAVWADDFSSLTRDKREEIAGDGELETKIISVSDGEGQRMDGRLGYVDQIQADIIGYASQLSGAGREKKEDSIDLSAGILLHRKVGDSVSPGEALATVYGRDEEKVLAAAEKACGAFSFSNEPPQKKLLIKSIITG